MQVLKQIPENVLISVLSASTTPLNDQLFLLPNHLHEAAVHAAFPSIQASRSLDLASNHKLDATRCTALYMWLWPFLAKITSLTLRGRSLMRSLSGLGPNLASITSLQHLDLAHNSLGDSGATMIGPHLASLSSLTLLSLSSNGIGDRGAMLLGPHLASLTSLNHLDISYNSIGEEGVTALGPHLASLRTLQHLDIAVNRIDSQGGIVLGCHLARLSFLRHLDISNNRIGDDGATELGPHLASLTRLQYLDLRNNGIRGCGLVSLFLCSSSRGMLQGIVWLLPRMIAQNIAPVSLIGATLGSMLSSNKLSSTDVRLWSTAQ